MKNKLSLLTCALLFSFGSKAQNELITTWITDNAGTSTTTQITIPTDGLYTYNYNVDWNDDGIFDEFGLTGNVTHDFGTAGTYTIRIEGTFPKFYFNSQGDRRKILSVDQWGSIQWLNMNYAFSDCSNLSILASDAPDLSSLTNANFAFSGSGISSGLSNWDVSNVQSFQFMLAFCGNLNDDLSGWNTSSATNFSGLFRNSPNFDSNLASWDVSSVTNLSSMLQNAGLSTWNYDATLNGWANQTVQTGLNFHAGSSTYCNATTARATLTGTNGWTITDAGTNCTGAEFITTWQTDNAGTSNSTSIEIPTSSSYTYNYNVDWNNDGIMDETGITGSITHDFGTAGTYTIRITGDFPMIQFESGGDDAKILDIAQWGSLAWKSMYGAFGACPNLTGTASDYPNTSAVTDFRRAFNGCTLFNGDLSNWDVSNVTLFGSCFRDAASFNSDISNWDMSSAANLTWFFRDATTFNQPIGNWNMSNVWNFQGVFLGATSFNQDLSGWNTSNASIMNGLFNGATSFDQSLASWDMTGVTSAPSMFAGGAGISTANYDATLIAWSSQTLGNNVSINFGTSQYCTAATERAAIISTYSWNISDGGQNCPSDHFFTTWKTDNPGTSSSTSIMIPTTGTGYNYDVDWNNDGIFDEFGITGNVTHDFGTAGTYPIRIQGSFPRIYFNNSDDKEKLMAVDQWGTTSWTSMENAFYGCVNLHILATDAPDLSGATSTEGMFRLCIVMDENLDSWDVSTITTMERMFSYAYDYNQDMNSWNVSNVTNMKDMFNRAYSFSGAIGAWNTSNVTTMESMFNSAYDFNYDISSWNTSSVTNMASMFDETDYFNYNISGWDVSNVTDMSRMFRHAYGFNQSLNTWTTSSVTNMSNMFTGADIFNSNISSWDVSNVTDMSYMFETAYNFNQNIGTWDVSSVTDMTGMFYYAEDFNQVIALWNVSNVTNMSNMFDNALSFDQNLSNWNISSLTNATDMFASITLSTPNYDALLIGWNAQPHNTSVVFSGGNSKYCSGEDARTAMISNDSWTITDGGPDDNTPPTPDLTTLPDLTDECEIIALFPPTGTDNCATSITVTHNATLPITTQGTTVVTWTFDDGHGNTSTQAQNVIIDDVTDPTPDIPVLADINAECEVTNLIAPTATDNCLNSIVSVTHNAILPITTQGTTVVTWTFDDGEGNTVMQTQNVIIDDVTPPTPDVAVLSDVVSECEVTSLIPPTATDNCPLSTVSVTNNATLPISAQGTTVVTWTFDDGEGNTITQTQNVIIDDTTGPTPDVAVLPAITANCDVTSLTSPTATDNCSSSVVTVTHDATLPISAIGTTVVTWTYDDGNGNQSTQTQDVTITPIVTTVSYLDPVTLQADNSTATSYQWLDCLNGMSPISGATSSQFVATANGSYSVVIFQGSCSDTSACMVVNEVGIVESGSLEINIYPNPTSGKFTIDCSSTSNESGEIMNSLGQIVAEFEIINGTSLVDLVDMPSGVYLVHVKTQEGIFRIVKY